MASAPLYKLSQDFTTKGFPSAAECWGLSEFPLDFYAQLEPAMDFPLESAASRTKQGWVGGRRVTGRAQPPSQVVVTPGSAGLSSGSGSLLSATTLSRSQALYATDVSCSTPSEIGGHCIELFGLEFSSGPVGAPNRDGPGGSTLRFAAAVMPTSGSGSAVSAGGWPHAQVPTGEPRVPAAAAAAAPLKAHDVLLPRDEQPCTFERIPSLSHPTDPAQIATVPFLWPRPALPSSLIPAIKVGAAGNASPALQRLQPLLPPAQPLTSASAIVRTTAHRSPPSSASTGSMKALPHGDADPDNLFLDDALHPDETSFERASWTLSQYRSSTAGTFLVPCRSATATGSIDSSTGHAPEAALTSKRGSPAPGLTSATGQYTLGRTPGPGSHGQAGVFRLVPPLAAKPAPKPSMADLAVSTLAPLLRPGSGCTNVGTAAALRAFLSQLSACARLSGLGRAEFVSAALPMGLSSVPWESTRRPLLSWCIIGDKLRPEYTFAALFALRQSSGEEAPSSFFVLPLMPSVIVNAAVLSTSSKDPATPSENPTVASIGSPAAGAPPVPLLSRLDRWRALGSILSVPGLRKCAWDAKGSLYSALRCPLTAGAPFAGICDPGVLAWLLSPDDFAKGDVRPPAWAAAVLSNGRGSSALAASCTAAAPLDSGSGVPATSSAASTLSGAVAGVTLSGIAVAYRVALMVAPQQHVAPLQHPAIGHLLLLERVFSQLEMLCESSGLLGVLHGLESPLLPVVAAMEVAGVAFDSSSLRAAECSIRARLAEFEADAALLAGCAFSLSSPAQVAEVLYERLGLEEPRARSEAHGKQAARKGDKRHASVDDAALAALAASGTHPLPELIRGHRKLFKLLTGSLGPLTHLAVPPWDASDMLHRTDVVACSDLGLDAASGSAALKRSRDDVLDDDSLSGAALPAASLARLHTRLHTTSTGTGRLSSAEPNLQNLQSETGTSRVGSLLAHPLRSREGAAPADAAAASHSVRSAIKPRHSGWVLVSIDYSQIEMRVVAHLCQDPTLLSVFVERESDIYCSMASLVFAVPIAVVSAEQRKQAKAVVLGLCYGLGASELAGKLGISEAQAKDVRDKFIARFPGLRSWMAAARSFGSRHGRVPTMAGRFRPLPGFSAQGRAETALAERQSVNTIVQGTAADLIKCAMVLVDRALRSGLECRLSSQGDGSISALTPATPRMLLQVHDELLFECPPGEPLERLVATVTHIMTVEAVLYVALLSPFFKLVAPQQHAACVGLQVGKGMAETGALPVAAATGTFIPVMQEAAQLLGGSPLMRVPLLVNVEVGADWGSLVPFPGPGPAIPPASESAQHEPSRAVPVPLRQYK